LRHDFSLEGYGYRLRPVNDQDTAFILSLRTDPHLSEYLHKTPPNPVAHLRWLENYYKRSGDYYFIVERQRGKSPEGTIGLYGVDTATRSAEWGRWVIQTGSLGAIESAALIYRFAFDRLDLDLVWCRTFISNEKVLAFHDACGCRRCGVVRMGEEEFVEHQLLGEEWKSVGRDLEKKAERIAERLCG
jgi:RimJ/RimL family protein N-acetyltransferase